MGKATIVISFDVELDDLDNMTDQEILDHVQSDTDVYGRITEGSTSWTVRR